MRRTGERAFICTVLFASKLKQYMQLEKSQFEFVLNDIRYRITFTRSAPAPGKTFTIFICTQHARGCNWEYFSSGNFTGVPDLDSAEKLLNQFYKPKNKKQL